LHFLYIRPWILDDAFISFRYAKNLAEGFGLVFNPSDTPVEGYTNFLWIIILSLGHKLGFNIVTLSQVLGYLFAIGTILIILFVKWTKKITPPIQIASALILSSSGAFTVWGASGMETSLFIFLFTLCLLLFVRILERNLSKRRPKSLIRLSFLIALLALTRPEGYLVFIVFGLLVFTFKVLNKRNIATKELVCYLLPFLIVVAAQIVFRLVYYNDVLPNTFYNKVGSGSDQYLRGLRYTKDFIVASLPLVFFSAITLLLSSKKRWEDNPILFASFAVLVPYSAYVIFVGGDVMPAYRFYSPLVPILAILAVSGIHKSAMKINSRLHISKQLEISTFSFIVALALAFNIWQWKYEAEINKHLKGDMVAQEGKETGLWLKENFDADTVVATNTAGTIPFYSGFRTIDMLGLNDKHIAKRDMPDIGKGFPGHEKTDGDYILKQNPDIIIFGSSLGSEMPIFISDKELQQKKEFQEKYELKKFMLPSGQELILYLRQQGENYT